MKLLIGGSPCTYWSIAQTKNRETEATGIGWELFRNYLIAKEKFKPDFFLYENNVSAAKPIKEQIRKELKVGENGARYIEIDSALVSAQSRKRFYVHNGGDVGQPENRGILLRDILETGESLSGNEKSYCLTATYGGACAWNTLERSQREMVAEIALYNTPHGFNKGGITQDKAPTLTARGSWQTNHHVLTPVRVGAFPRPNGELSTSAAMRIYSVDGKGCCLKSNVGGLGVKTGLYAIPTDKPLYEVRDGQITIKGKQYPTRLADGYYTIRKLTVTECCRLQTLPDDYCRAVSDSQGYKGLGNGWTAEVIVHILNGALKNIPKDEEIVVLSMYDGIGTGRYCLDKMGFTNIRYFAYEIDKYAKRIALSNYPDIIQLGDAFAVRDDAWALPRGQAEWKLQEKGMETA